MFLKKGKKKKKKRSEEEERKKHGKPQKLPGWAGEWPGGGLLRPGF